MAETAKSKKTSTKPGKEILESLVMSAKRDYSRYVQTKKLLENPSQVLKKTKEGSRLGLDLWREMEDDDQIDSNLRIRKLTVASFPFDIICEDGTDKDLEQAKSIKKQITPVYRRLVKECQDAMGIGYAVVEKFWEIPESKVELTRVQGHKQEQFVFAEDGEILMLTEGGTTIPVNPQRVIVATFDETKGNRYGRCLLTGCFWPWYFKKHGMLFWSNYLEKFGQPTVVGKYPSGTPKEKQQKLLEACQAIQNDMAVTLDQAWVVELLEAQRSGALDSYEKFINYCDRCISKVILMTTLISNEAEYGARAMAEVHQDISNKCFEDDAQWIAEILTDQVVKLLAQWNYNFTTPPELVIQYSTEDTSKTMAERDEILSRIAPMSVTYIYNKYGIPEPGDDDYVVFNGVVGMKKNILAGASLQGQEPAGDSLAAGKEAEFSNGDEEIPINIDENERFIFEENEYIETLYTKNQESLKKAYDMKLLEQLLEQADDYPQAILLLNDFKSKNLAQAWEPHLAIARLLSEYSVQGQMEAVKAANAAGAEFAAAFDEEDFKKLEPAEAIRWFKGRVSVKRNIWKILDDEVKQSAFYVSQLEDLNLINYVKEKMIKALQEGITFREFKKQLFQESGGEPFFGHMYTAYHTNMYSALAEQNEAALLRNTDQFKWWRYSAVLDGRTRPHHAAMHGIVARFDDPFWKMWSPPNGYNCRCRKVIAFNWQVEAGNRKNRQMGYLNLKPDPGWEHGPSDGLFKNYLKLLNDKKQVSMQLNNQIREAHVS